MMGRYWRWALLYGMLAAALLFLGHYNGTRAHEWYDAACCSNNDCEQLPDDAVTIEEGGYRVRYLAKMGLSVDVLVPFSGAKPSRDGHYHGCATAASFLCLYVPVNT